MCNCSSAVGAKECTEVGGHSNARVEKVNIVMAPRMTADRATAQLGKEPGLRMTCVSCGGASDAEV